MPDPKPDNSTQQEIHALSDKFDEFKETSAETRREDKQEQHASQGRLQWRIGIYVALFTVLIGFYLESVRRELAGVREDLKGTNTAINSLVTKTSEQAIDIAVIREKSNTHSEMRILLDKMNREMQAMQLEIERLKKQ
jgi:hypothetical protein